MSISAPLPASSDVEAPSIPLRALAPWALFFGLLAVLVLFFVSGADANTFVLSMMSSRGALEPTKLVLAIWGALTGLCAALLLLTGGLQALQQAAMLSALPFTVIVALLAVSLVMQLKKDPHFDYTRDVRREDLRTGVLRLPFHGPARKTESDSAPEPLASVGQRPLLPPAP